jgi:hypothetical protein
MSHFEVSSWVDYVRGIAGVLETKAMASHLKAGCAECLETYLWLEKVSSVASSSQLVEVPETLVRRAEQIFQHPPAFRFDTLFPLIAHMVLDAGRTLQPVGVRTAGGIDHTLYEAGDFTIDLRQESSRGSAHISLIGQISSERTAGDSDLRFPLALFAGNSMVAGAVSNRFGEFSLTYSRHSDMKLAIAIVRMGRKIEIPLTRTPRTTDDKKKDD